MPVDPYALRPGQGISVEQTENSVKLIEAKITLHEQRRNAMTERGKRERSLMRGVLLALHPEQAPVESPWSAIFGNHLNSDGTWENRGLIDRWLEAHKSFDDAQTAIWDVEIAELKAQAGILRAAIEGATDPAKRLARPDMM